jgi:hypothetical protein
LVRTDWLKPEIRYRSVWEGLILSKRFLTDPSNRYANLMLFLSRVFLALIGGILVLASDSTVDPYNAYIEQHRQASDPTQIGIAIKDNIDLAGTWPPMAAWL